jgi:hypothetical protein
MSLTYVVIKLNMNIASVPLLAVISVTCRDVIRDKIDNHSALSPTVRRCKRFEHGNGKDIHIKIQAAST